MSLAFAACENMAFLFFFTNRYVEACITNALGKATMDKSKDLINAVLERAKEIDSRKKLSCAEAFELAKEFKSNVAEIGRICNQKNIRICQCQLGCFS